MYIIVQNIAKIFLMIYSIFFITITFKKLNETLKIYQLLYVDNLKNNDKKKKINNVITSIILLIAISLLFYTNIIQDLFHFVFLDKNSCYCENEDALLRMRIRNPSDRYIYYANEMEDFVVYNSSLLNRAAFHLPTDVGFYNIGWYLRDCPNIFHYTITSMQDFFIAALESGLISQTDFNLKMSKLEYFLDFLISSNEYSSVSIQTTPLPQNAIAPPTDEIRNASLALPNINIDNSNVAIQNSEDLSSILNISRELERLSLEDNNPNLNNQINVNENPLNQNGLGNNPIPRRRSGFLHLLF